MGLKEQVEFAIEAQRKAAEFPRPVEVYEKSVIVDTKTKRPIPSSFQAYIMPPEFERVVLEFKPSFEQKCPGQTIPTVKGLGNHEFTHRRHKLAGNRGCPMRIEDHLKICESIWEVLQENHFAQEDMLYVANIFEDWVVNSLDASVLSVDGLMNFYVEAGETAQEKKFGSFFEAYMKLQGMFFPKQVARRAEPFYKNERPVTDAIAEFFEKSGLNKFSMEVEEYLGSSKAMPRSPQKVKMRDKSAMLDYMTTPAQWPELARVFTEVFMKFMTPGYAVAIPGMSGEGIPGRADAGEGGGEKNPDEIDDKGRLIEADDKMGDDGITLPSVEGDEGEDEDVGDDVGDDAEDALGKNKFDDGKGIDWENLPGGNMFDAMMKDPELRKELAWQSYQQGKARPWWLKYDEGVAAVYQREARRLQIQSDVGQKVMEFPLVRYDPRELDWSRHAPRHLQFRMGADGVPRLMSKRLAITVSEEYMAGEEGFPEFRLVWGDSSESMRHAPNCDGNCKEKCCGDTKFIPWGTKSKYHAFCLSFEGLVEFLDSKGILVRQRIVAGDFSNVSRIGVGLDRARRIVYSPQFGWTNMAEDAIDRIFEGEGSLVFTASDGEVQNWSTVKDKFLELARRHYYFHVQIGAESQMSKDLRGDGYPVYSVMGGLDLWATVFRVSNDMYGPRKRQRYDQLKEESVEARV